MMRSGKFKCDMQMFGLGLFMNDETEICHILLEVALSVSLSL